MSKTRYFSAADGTKLAYLDAGEASALPILCLSGLTRSKEDFNPAMPALQGYRVIRMDYRGRGESGYSGALTYSVAQEAADALALLDHLGLEKVGLIGTSRGGLIGLYLAAVAKHCLRGLCLVDIGPELAPTGLARIGEGLGRRPTARSLAEMAALLPQSNPGFAHVPAADWQAMAARLYRETPEGLTLRYDPALAESFAASLAAPPVDAWPLWTATEGLPLALIRGANSDLLSAETAAQMRALRPDLIFANVPDRAHVPFLNEPEAQHVLRLWLECLS